MSEQVERAIRLAECEAVIERGLQTFIEVGTALMTIREQKLYRYDGYPTFQRYCLDRWGFADSRARQLVGAVETVTAVTVAGLPAPGSESVARALNPLKRHPDLMRKAWEEAVRNWGPNPTKPQVAKTLKLYLTAARVRDHHRVVVESTESAARHMTYAMDHVRTACERAGVEFDIGRVWDGSLLDQLGGDFKGTRFDEDARIAYEWFARGLRGAALAAAILSGPPPS
jgi:hypothetical protein